VVEAHRGEVPAYLQKLEEQYAELTPLADDAAALRAALKGDLHAHSDWSDGGSPIREMAEAAISIGHEYLALTDHSPRLTVANGLSPQRLEQQLDVVAALNDELKPFRILTGIECDINVDGSLDQTDELLGRLDIVVASVHSELRAPRAAMTERMLAAVANPHTDVLGHCTGRLVIGRQQRNGTQKPRPESDFDADAVFRACVEQGTAVEINSRPERLDPPRRLLSQAVELGCDFSIDTDAHAPGQLDWQDNGCVRAVECGVPADRVINTRTAEQLLARTRG
jgi:putative hydrolase